MFYIISSLVIRKDDQGTLDMTLKNAFEYGKYSAASALKSLYVQVQVDIKMTRRSISLPQLYRMVQGCSSIYF